MQENNKRHRKLPCALREIKINGVAASRDSRGEREIPREAPSVKLVGIDAFDANEIRSIGRVRGGRVNAIGDLCGILTASRETDSSPARGSRDSRRSRVYDRPYCLY